MRFALGALIDKKEAAAKPRPTARGRDTGPIGGPIERVGAWRRCCVLKFSERLFLRRSFFPANSSAEIPAIRYLFMDGCLRTSTATFQGSSSHCIRAVQVYTGSYRHDFSIPLGLGRWG